MDDLKKEIPDLIAFIIKGGKMPIKKKSEFLRQSMKDSVTFMQPQLKQPQTQPVKMNIYNDSGAYNNFSNNFDNQSPLFSNQNR